MTPKKFFDWQTAGGTNDVMRLVDCLERADLGWCAIGGIAVNHWVAEPMVTQDVDRDEKLTTCFTRFWAKSDPLL